MEWTEDEFLSNEIWYHATQEYHCESILKDGVIADVNSNKALDFGYGFYLTPNFKWAKDYIAKLPDKDGVILEFHFSPKKLLNGSKNYRFFGRLNREFAEFVFKNRMFYKEYPSKCVHNYLMVAGVMSDGNQPAAFKRYLDNGGTEAEKEILFSELCRPEEDWQLLIHSQKLCDRLQVAAVYDMEGVQVC